MKLCWFITLAILLPMRVASGQTANGRVATVTINPSEITLLRLRPEFESIIRMPEEVTSVILGSPGSFKAEHNEGEPDYVYVKPITKEPAQSNLLVATKSGQHVTLELITDGSSSSPDQPVDFLIEYRAARSFLISSDALLTAPAKVKAEEHERSRTDVQPGSGTISSSALDVEFAQQQRINAPKWIKWDRKEIETSIGDVRQWDNQTMISYSILNSSDHPLEIVPPQIQITGRKANKKRKKVGRSIISDQLEIRDFKLSTTRLEAGARADGVVVFDRPNFKESTEKLFLQLAQADQVEQPILIPLPFTPPISGNR